MLKIVPNLAQCIAYAKFGTAINAAVIVDFLILNNKNLTNLVGKIEIETIPKKYSMHSFNALVVFVNFYNF